ncbi:MAG: hypothetical protein ACR5KV_08340 [Wolbachia sp.]
MLTFVVGRVRNNYNWLIKKSRPTALDFIVLFNKEYADNKRIEYMIKNLKTVLNTKQQMENLRKDL